MLLPHVLSVYNYNLVFIFHVRSGAVRCGTALQAGRSGVRFRLGSLGYVNRLHRFSAALRPCLSTAATNKQDGRCVGLATLPPSCANSVEILRTSASCSPKGSVKACNCRGEKSDGSSKFVVMYCLTAVSLLAGLRNCAHRLKNP